MKTLDFYYDFSSPWTYLAQTQMKALSARTGAKVVYHPLFLGGLFKLTGHPPTFNEPLKWKYMLDDMQDWATHYGVTLKMPSRFPANTLKALRAHAAIAAQGKDPEPFIDAVFKAYWVDDADIAGANVLKSVLDKTGYDGAAILAATDTEPVKNAVKESTDKAHARGVFGAPTFFVGQKMFWGNDRLAFAERALK